MIFQADIRVSTIAEIDGEWAIGTKISPEATQVLLKEKGEYSGEARFQNLRNSFTDP